MATPPREPVAPGTNFWYVESRPNDKLGKLSQRARRLEGALGVDVHPILLTRAPMETIPETHRTKAREEGIALVAREQLLELGERMLQTTDVQKTTAFLA